MSIGHKVWAVAGGHIPTESTGKEPSFTSRDELAVLNCTHEEAEITLTVFYSDRDPAGPYNFTVSARRTRHVRVNDLIDPLPVPLDMDYALLLESTVPVVVHFYRRDTSQAENAWLALTPVAAGD